MNLYRKIVSRIPPHLLIYLYLSLVRALPPAPPTSVSFLSSSVCLSFYLQLSLSLFRLPLLHFSLLRLSFMFSLLYVYISFIELSRLCVLSFPPSLINSPSSILLSPCHSICLSVFLSVWVSYCFPPLPSFFFLSLIHLCLYYFFLSQSVSSSFFLSFSLARLSASSSVCL